MNRNSSPDTLFITEYIKNVLYFATVRQGKVLRSTADTHYFCIDNDLVYENYYSDFGPLNLGCVYKYCALLNEKLKQYLNKQTIVHYTSIDPKKKANAAFLLGCYGVLYLSLSPKDALKPLLAHGQSYRPFQDATQGDSCYTISLLDCLQAIKRARELGLFNFHDFNYEEYDRLDKIHGGDLNWIVPGKFLAFIGPEDYSVSLYHPPEMYIDYFLANNVKIVIRLNKRLYDGNIFNNAGIVHYDLFFPDGTCPPRHILLQFLKISEETNDAIAVHCKVMTGFDVIGLGRTGSLIGCYLIKHYRMTAHEAIGWMRICRPGSVIGHQQGWLEQHEAWLIKLGIFYRKRIFGDSNKLPVHEYGVYSIAEKTRVPRSINFHNKLPSPSPTRVIKSEPSPTRPQSSKLKEQSSKYRDDKMDKDVDKSEEEEVFLTSCDLTVTPTAPLTHLKGCVIRNNTISEEDPVPEIKPLWKRILCCGDTPCLNSIKDFVWIVSVRCARVAPWTYKLCFLIDSVTSPVANKTEKEQYEWHVRSSEISTQSKIAKGDRHDSSTSTRRGIGAGDPRPQRSSSRSTNTRPNKKADTIKSNDSKPKNLTNFLPTTFRSSNGPVIKSVNDAKNFLIRSSMYNEERERYLNKSITVARQDPVRPIPNYFTKLHNTTPKNTPSSVNPPRPSQAQQRRRLGRSPSPGPRTSKYSRASNTMPVTHEKNPMKESSALREALSRLKFKSPREGSIGAASVGAASLGARREAPAPKQAPSVRSDERPLATQGDMLNSIKFQRRLRETLHTEKFCKILPDKNSSSFLKNSNSKSSTAPRYNLVKPEFSTPKEKPSTVTRSFFSPTRPNSPRGRYNSHVQSFF